MPNLVFADAKGNIMDFEGLAMVGRSGDYFYPMPCEETIELPRGSQLYVLPKRHPVGFDRHTGEMVVLTRNPYDESQQIFAVATFLPAAYTQTYLASWERRSDSSELPFFAYTALGWHDGFVATGIRTDPSLRQDPNTFHHDRIRQGIRAFTELFPDNRLVEHLQHCAMVYECPAALNLFQDREEAPLPASPFCNARCVGCISKQDPCRPPSPQQRIDFIPSPQEIAEVALKHIFSAQNPVVSFGQGCEGEPLLVADTLRDAIRLIRKETSKGVINLNTNASLPEKVAELADAGLDSMRISMNSARRSTYEAYFQPSYDFDALFRSAQEMKRRERFVSINLFVFPGLSDAPKEVEALKRFVSDAKIDMIQWRNLNIDPDHYLDTIGQKLPAGMGIPRLIHEIPVRAGYFNPYLDLGMS
ncbi:MAG TPA: radical SAM protein [Deltaproteobacteria bacterium]|nr:radical SAM protein [Deltaproteobacteria bacterium]